MNVKEKVLWALAAMLGGAGAFVLYLSISAQSLTLGLSAVVIIGVASGVVWLLPD